MSGGNKCMPPLSRLDIRAGRRGETPNTVAVDYRSSFLLQFGVSSIESIETRGVRTVDFPKEVAAANMSHDKTAIQRQIDATDRRIDKLVYELYDLTDDEIRIVEEATR